MKDKGNLTIGIGSAIGCEILYGMSFMFTKQATNMASPVALLGWRFSVAVIGMSLLIIMGVLKINLKGKSLKPLLVIALLFPVIYFLGETFGISKTTAAESGVALAGIPVTALIASTLLIGKKPNRFEIIGIAVTCIGVVITVLAVGGSSSFSLEGYLFLLVAVVAYSVYCVFVEKADEYTGVEITYIMLVVGAIVFASLAIIEGIKNENVEYILNLPLKNSGFLAAILYQGIGCSILAFLLSNIAIAKLGVNKTASFIGIATVVSIASSAIVLKENFTYLQGIGAAVILAGVYIANGKKDESTLLTYDS